MAAAPLDGYGIAAPLVFYQAEPERIWSCGDRLVPGTLFTRGLYRDQRAPAGLPAVLPVDFVSGAALLVRRAVWESVGWWDESLFMYGEEVDFLWRARLKGWRAACVTGARLWHAVSASSNRDRPLARFLRLQNQARFYRRYARGAGWLAMLVLSGARALALAAREPALARPTLAGWWRGWAGRPRTTWS